MAAYRVKYQNHARSESDLDSLIERLEHGKDELLNRLNSSEPVEVDLIHNLVGLSFLYKRKKDYHRVSAYLEQANGILSNGENNLPRFARLKLRMVITGAKFTRI